MFKFLEHLTKIILSEHFPPSAPVSPKIFPPDGVIHLADFRMNQGLWGKNITWTDGGKFNIHEQNKVVGHSTPIPEVGQTIVAELKNSWAMFRFVEVQRARGVSDMFFGVVETIDQWKKPTDKD